MINILIKWFLLALGLFSVAWIVPGIEMNSLTASIVAVFVIGLINTFIRPIALILFLPINIATLGCFTLIINALLLCLTAYFVPGFVIKAFTAALIGAILFSIYSMFIEKLSKDK